MPVPNRAILEEHLRTNHLPSIPAAFADAAIAAIEAVEDGDPERMIDYGAGLSVNGRRADTAASICDEMHLWELVDEGEPDAGSDI